MDKIKLEPCPFCGEEQKLNIAGGGASHRWHVGCGTCYVNGPMIRSNTLKRFGSENIKEFCKQPEYRQAIELWNKRILVK